MLRKHHMKHSLIASFLSGASSPEAFGEKIADEVAACLDGIRKNGVGPVIVTDGPTMIVEQKHAARLLQAFVDQLIPYEAANYVADGLMISDDFDFADDAVANAIWFLADDSRAPTLNEIRKELANLA